MIFWKGMRMASFADAVHENALAHGFWEPIPSYEEQKALFHTEVSEAVEESREGMPGLYYIRNEIITPDMPQFERIADITHKIEGQAVELGDLIIRIVDTARGMKGIVFPLNAEKFDHMIPMALKEAAKRNWNDGEKTELEFYSQLHKHIALDHSFATIILRTVFYCLLRGWDLEEAMMRKMNYNTGRSYKHGKRI
jgi:hypothetical protein